MQQQPDSTSLADGGSFSAATMDGVRVALAHAALDGSGSIALASALSCMCGEARARGYPAERVVISLKHAWRTARRPMLVPPSEWEEIYRMALGRSLDLFFGEPRS
jgi:hypothetical protein